MNRVRRGWRARYFAWLVRRFPPRFRARHGTAMYDLLHYMRAELGRSPSFIRLCTFYLAVTWDVMRRLRIERRRARRTDRHAQPRGPMTRWIDDLRQDLTFVFRGLRRAPGFTIIAVLTLAVGIGANAAIFSVVKGVLLQPLPYPDPDRLVMIFNQYHALGVERAGQNPGDFQDYQRQTDVFEQIGAFGGTHNQTLMGLGPATRVPTSSATDNVFPMLGVTPVVGRLFEPDDDHTRVLISHGFWQTRLGGAADVVGRTFELNGTTVTVINVLPADFLLHAPAHLELPRTIAVWNPIRQFLGTPDAPDRTAHWMTVIAKLKESATADQAQAQLDAVARWQRENFSVREERDAAIAVVPMHDEIVSAARPTLLALFGAAGVVLLIACVNVANLLLARGQTRRREIAVRAALGGSRARLVRQLLTESLALALAGGALGSAIAFLGVDAIMAVRPDGLPFVDNIRVDRGVLVFVLSASVGSTLLFGLFPALTGSRAPLAGFLTSRTIDGGRRGESFRATLVVLEVALSMILLVAGGLLVRSFFLLNDVSPGYRTDNVLTFVIGLPNEVWEGPSGPEQMNPRFQDFYVRAQAAIEAVPGVESVAAMWPTPLSGSTGGRATYTDDEGAGDEQSQLGQSHLITPDLFETLGIPIVAGRALTLTDAHDKLVVDERMAEKMWPGENPLGKRLKIGWWWGPTWGEVVGVAKSVRTQNIREPDPESVYRKAAVFAYGAPTVIARTSADPLGVADAVRRVVPSLHPEAAVEEMRSLASYRDGQLAATRFVMTLIGVFAAIALSFAAVGLYGVISYLVSQRTREMGVRLAFGARGSQVFALVMRRGLALTLAGVVVGLAGALGTTRLLSSYLFGVAPHDPVTIAGIAALLALVATAACARPALRATSVDPARSLAE